MNGRRSYPIFQALLAAALFGASAPASKTLLGDIEPLPLAGFLYLGSGIGLLIFWLFGRLAGNAKSAEAGLAKKDAPWLAGAIIAGGVAAPVLLMTGLKTTPAATASLLLNFESAATALIAALAFREHIGKRIWVAVACMTFGSVALSLNIEGGWGFSVGAIGILGACAFWGIDNNLTAKISAKNPSQIAIVKGICAGTFSLMLAFATGSAFPGAVSITYAMLLGSLSYGASLVLFISAMRSLGAARSGALFATGPFFGVVISLIAFKELPGIEFLVSLPVMVAGALLLSGEKHTHIHFHAAIEHEHAHVHDDEHHLHEHGKNFDENIPHSHVHKHEETEHSHRHTPDLHHRHEHGKDKNK
ncbi:MAG: DMT family transporter [Candidatus Thermoplasmatota archaeon]|nr:DMT family transporter [Candidatus Thermoplasmatota archaeon]